MTSMGVFLLPYCCIRPIVGVSLLPYCSLHPIMGVSLLSYYSLRPIMGVFLLPYCSIRPDLQRPVVLVSTTMPENKLLQGISFTPRRAALNMVTRMHREGGQTERRLPREQGQLEQGVRREERRVG